jgi:hypothetical protein
MATAERVCITTRVHRTEQAIEENCGLLTTIRSGDEEHLAARLEELGILPHLDECEFWKTDPWPG